MLKLRLRLDSPARVSSQTPERRVPFLDATGADSSHGPGDAKKYAHAPNRHPDDPDDFLVRPSSDGRRDGSDHHEWCANFVEGLLTAELHELRR